MTIIQLLKQFILLPQTVASAFKQKRREVLLKEPEMAGVIHTWTNHR